MPYEEKSTDLEVKSDAPQEPSEDWNDKTFVLKQVKIDGRKLKFASESLKNDVDVVRAAIKDDDGFPLRYALKDAVLAILRESQELHIYRVSSALLEDRTFGLAAVEISGRCYPALHIKLRNDKEITMEAIKHGISQIPQSLGPALPDVPDIGEALIASGYSFTNLPDSYKGIRSIAVAAVSKKPSDLPLVLKYFQDDVDIIMLGIKQDLKLIGAIPRLLLFDVKLETAIYGSENPELIARFHQEQGIVISHYLEDAIIFDINFRNKIQALKNKEELLGKLEVKQARKPTPTPETPAPQLEIKQSPVINTVIRSDKDVFLDKYQRMFPRKTSYSLDIWNNFGLEINVFSSKFEEIITDALLKPKSCREVFVSLGWIRVKPTNEIEILPGAPDAVKDGHREHCSVSGTQP